MPGIGEMRGGISAQDREVVLLEQVIPVVFERGRLFEVAFFSIEFDELTVRPETARFGGELVNHVAKRFVYPRRVEHPAARHPAAQLAGIDNGQPLGRISDRKPSALQVLLDQFPMRRSRDHEQLMAEGSTVDEVLGDRIGEGARCIEQLHDVLVVRCRRRTDCRWLTRHWFPERMRGTSSLVREYAVKKSRAS